VNIDKISRKLVKNLKSKIWFKKLKIDWVYQKSDDFSDLLNDFSGF
jgi:hypothetical protein